MKPEKAMSENIKSYKVTSQLQIQVGQIHWNHSSSIIQQSHYWKTSSVLRNSIFCTGGISWFFSPPEWNTVVAKKIYCRSLIMKRALGIKKRDSMNLFLCKRKWRFLFNTQKRSDCSSSHKFEIEVMSLKSARVTSM